MTTDSRPSLLLPALACLTLGLAPFAPLPHVVEKILWLVEGRQLRSSDWFDLALHGSPWAWLGVAVAARLRAWLRVRER